MRHRKLRRTTVIMVGLGAFLVGLVLGRKVELPFTVVIILGLLFLFTLKRIQLATIIAIALFGLAFGIWRGGDFRSRIQVYEELYGQDVIVRVTAATDGSYAESGNLGFDAGRLEFIEPAIGSLPGSLKIETVGLPAVFRSDRLQIQGKLYPAGGSRQGSIKFASAKVVKRHFNAVEKLRLKFVAAMQTVLPEPQASFGLGLLIGQRSTLPEDVTEQLSIVGLTHIIAVSGYNLTILVNFVKRHLGQRSKYQIVLLSGLLITSFLLVTGFSASIVRAAIVSGLGLGAWYYGRSFRPVLLLLLAAALTAGWYPIYIWSDIGWYLSFLAFFGVLVIAPLIMKRFWKREPWGLMPTIIESICAIIMTAPLIMHIFEEISLIALPANALVVPLVPYAMALSVVAGLGGMILTHLGAWLAWPAAMVMSAMLGIVQLLSRLPNALVKQSLSMPMMLSLYSLAISLSYLLWVKVRPKYGTITEINTEK